MASSGVQPGVYFIVNFAPGNLAVNYEGEGMQLKVIPREDINTQMWVVSGDAGSPQAITPAPSPSLQTEPAGDYVEPTPEKYTWNINGSASGAGYTIQSIKDGFIWGLDNPVPKELVTLKGTSNQIWGFNQVA